MTPTSPTAFQKLLASHCVCVCVCCEAPQWQPIGLFLSCSVVSSCCRGLQYLKCASVAFPQCHFHCSNCTNSTLAVHGGVTRANSTLYLVSGIGKQTRHTCTQTARCDREKISAVFFSWIRWYIVIGIRGLSWPVLLFSADSWDRNSQWGTQLGWRRSSIRMCQNKEVLLDAALLTRLGFCGNLHVPCVKSAMD